MLTKLWHLIHSESLSLVLLQYHVQEDIWIEMAVGEMQV